jgi:hypothetical protein
MMIFLASGLGEGVLSAKFASVWTSAASSARRDTSVAR